MAKQRGKFSVKIAFSFGDSGAAASSAEAVKDLQTEWCEKKTSARKTFAISVTASLVAAAIWALVTG